MAQPGKITSNTGKATVVKQGHTASKFGNDPNVKEKGRSIRSLDPQS